jgi:uncharacterized membrane protein
MRNRNDELSKQYRSGVEDLTRHYRAGVDSLRDGYETARDRYADRSSNRSYGRNSGRRSEDDGSSVWGVLALAAVAGAAAVAAAPHVRKLLDERQGKGGDTGEDVSASIVIDRPAQELYDRWRRFEDFSDFIPDVISVEPVGPDAEESDWTVRGPAGAELHFRSCITEDEPGQTIAWESDDQPASHSGRVTFTEVGEGTEVRLELQLHPPAGALGAAVARLLGKSTGTDPKQQAERALRQFKRMMERGGSGSQSGSQSRSDYQTPMADPVAGMGSSNGMSTGSAPQSI